MLCSIFYIGRELVRLIRLLLLLLLLRVLGRNSSRKGKSLRWCRWESMGPPRLHVHWCPRQHWSVWDG